MDIYILLKKVRGANLITRQQFRTIKGQAIKGNEEGALKGLKKLMRKQGIQIEE